MRKMFMMLIILFLAYFGIQYLFTVFTKGHTVDYTLTASDKKINIHEVLTFNQKGEENNYYFLLDWETGKISFQTSDIMKKKEKVITNIYYLDGDGYQCVLPVVNGKIITDILCQKGEITYNYQDIKNNTPTLTTKVAEIKEYNSSQFLDQPGDDYNDNFLTVHRNQLIDGYNIAVDSYKGAYMINTELDLKVNQIRFYSEDVYTRPIAAVVKDRYISADYNEKYAFNSFILVDLRHSYKSVIKLKKPISFDSYIQGSVGSYLYLIDCANKIQYQIDVNKETIEQIGDASTGAKDYVKGEWVNTNIGELISSKKKFDNRIAEDFTEYERVERPGNSLSGYGYFYKKNGNKYEVYRSNVQNSSQLQYLFTTDRIDNMIYVKDSVYFFDGNKIRYYSDSTGVRTVVESKEFTFNNSLFFGVYYKK